MPDLSERLSIETSRAEMRLKLAKRHFFIAGFFLSLWLFYAMMIDQRFYIFEGGSAHYLVMAKHLAEFHKYYEYHLPIPEPHIKIPPLLSLLLSPVYYFLGVDILAIKILFFLFLICTGIFGYFLFFKLTSDWRKTLFICIFSLLFPLNYSLMLKVASEIPYLAFSYLSLFLLCEVEEKNFSIFKSVATGVILGLSCLLRTAGIAIVLAFLIYFLFRLKGRTHQQFFRQSIIILSISICFFSGWAIRNQAVRGEGQKGYFNFIFMDAKPGSLEQGMNDLQPPLWNGTAGVSVSGFASRAVYNAGFYLKSLLSQGGFKGYSYIFSFLLVLGLIGFISGFKKNLIVNISGIFYIAQIIIWPFSDARFLSPLTGILILWIVSGIDFIGGIFQSGRKAVVYFLFYFLLIIFGIGLLMKDYKILRYFKHPLYPRSYPVSRHFEMVPLTRERDSLARLLLWVRDNTEKDSVIASIDPYLVNLVTDRKGILFPATENNVEFWNYLAGRNVKYVMVDEIYKDLRGGISLMTEAYLLPALGRCPFKLNMVWQIPFSQTMLLSIDYEKR